MSIIVILLLTLAYGLFNRMWGGGWFKGNKIVACIGAGLSFCTATKLLSYGWYVVAAGGTIAGLLFWFGRMWTLSKWFTVFNPTLVSKDKGIFWINWATNLVKNIRLSGFIGMTLRGLFFAPLIAAVGYLNHNAFYFVPGVLLMGTAYGLQYYQSQKQWFAQDQLPVAECLYGAILGLLEGLALVVGRG